jgi:cytochrome b561
MQPANSLVGAWTGDVHVWLSYLLIGVAALHVGGALFHRFVLHDRVLARMVPAGWDRE